MKCCRVHLKKKNTQDNIALQRLFQFFLQSAIYSQVEMTLNSRNTGNIPLPALPPCGPVPVPASPCKRCSWSSNSPKRSRLIACARPERIVDDRGWHHLLQGQSSERVGPCSIHRVQGVYLVAGSQEHSGVRLRMQGRDCRCSPFDWNIHGPALAMSFWKPCVSNWLNDGARPKGDARVPRKGL